MTGYCKFLSVLCSFEELFEVSMIWKKVTVVVVFCSMWSYSSNNKYPNNSNCRKPYHQLVFMNREKLHNMEKANISGTCSWLNGCRREKKMCWKRKGWSQILWNARKLAVKYCEMQFRYDQWNCGSKVKYFKDMYRETSYMQAIAAASLMYSISVACSEGKIQGCKCADHGKSPGNSKWHWGGCGHNTKFAKKMAKNFLGIKKNEDGLSHLTYSNSEVGFRSIQNNVERKCRCHGVSGSCSIQTCWKSIKPFSKISEYLKNHYHTAILVNSSNTVDRTYVKNSLRQLVYLKTTLNLCQTTAGRRCNNTDNCATLCCGRGFFVKTIQIVYFCKCGWRDQEVFNGNSLVCEQCNKNQDIFICK